MPVDFQISIVGSVYTPPPLKKFIRNYSTDFNCISILICYTKCIKLNNTLITHRCIFVKEESYDTAKLQRFKTYI